MRVLIIVLIGAVAGGVLGYFGSCTTGACPLTANPYRGAGFGALLGLLIGYTGVGSPFASREPVPVSENIVYVQDLEGLRSLVATSRLPVLVDFYADWCGPCRRLAPELSALADEWKGHALIVKVNVDKQREIAASFQVSGIPDLRVFMNGEQKRAVTGYRPKTDLHALLVEAGARPPVL